MRYFLEELGYDTSVPSPIFLDSNSATKATYNLEYQSALRHVHRKYHWIRRKIETKEIRVENVPGADNLADIFTKPLGKRNFLHLREKLGLR